MIRYPPGTILISPSEFLASRLKEEGIEVNHILRNFVPDKHEYAIPKQERSELLYLGVLEPQKGPQILLDAFIRTIRDQGFGLHLMGDGSLSESLRKEVRIRGIASRVEIPGYRDLEGIGSVLRRAAALVIPSVTYENAPLSALEAFSMEIPVVGSNAGGLPEILGPSSGSMVFQRANASSLAENLRDLWTKKDMLGKLGEKARHAYLSNYTPEVHLKRYMDILSGQRE